MRTLVIILLLASFSATVKAESSLDALQPAGQALQGGQSTQSTATQSGSSLQQAADQTQALSFDPGLNSTTITPSVASKPWWLIPAGFVGVILTYGLWRFLT